MKQNGKRKLIRCLLGVLIVLNMVAIFAFSAQPGAESNSTSEKLSGALLENFVDGFSDLSTRKQEILLVRIGNPIRKMAHMIEFCSLGMLTFLFLLTWRGRIYTRYFASLSFVFFYAATDEIHQLFVPLRGARFSDVLVDLGGAMIGCTVVLLIAWRYYKKRGMPIEHLQVTRYRLQTDRELSSLRIAVASDLHGNEHTCVLEALCAEQPDLILIPGDLMGDRALRNFDNRGYQFLRACASIAPTYYSLGNHELACSHKGNPWRHPTPRQLDEEIRERIAETGVTLLENSCIQHGKLTICGLSSGINGRENKPDSVALQEFSQVGGYRILLCHHPEYFMPYIKKTGIELTVCGHAHGGHWRILGHGVYAPGQGLFPKYTAGVLEERCVISRGLGNHTIIPRICNRPELVIVELDS